MLRRFLNLCARVPETGIKLSKKSRSVDFHGLPKLINQPSTFAHITSFGIPQQRPDDYEYGKKNSRGIISAAMAGVVLIDKKEEDDEDLEMEDQIDEELEKTFQHSESDILLSTKKSKCDHCGSSLTWVTNKIIHYYNNL